MMYLIVGFAGGVLVATAVDYVWPEALSKTRMGVAAAVALAASLWDKFT